jgi:hypothetical protein
MQNSISLSGGIVKQDFSVWSKIMDMLWVDRET